MGVMARILRLWKADIHGVMDQLEDKELLLKQYLREMEDSLQKKEVRLQQIADAGRQIKNNLSARRVEIDKLEKDLTMALHKQNDSIAKLLIRKEYIQQKHCENMLQQSETLEEEREQLRNLLDEQRLQYETLKVKAATFCRQTEQTTFNEADTAYSGTSSLYTIDENEIELELMRRKESFQGEGNAA